MGLKSSKTDKHWINCILTKHEPLVNTIKESADSFDVLYNALLIEDEDKRIQTLRTLIDSGVDVNSCWKWNECNTSMMEFEREGLTVLMVAVRNGYVNCVQVLLDAGANVNQSDVSGQTALIVAADYENDKCVKLLIDAGANVNQSNVVGQTAFLEATSKGHVECIRLLLEAGADVDQSNVYDETALMTTACNGNDKCVKLLIGANANLNLSDEYNKTALMNAAEFASVKCMELLLEAGADVNGVDARGNTALICCLMCFGDSDKSKACLKLLIDAGADIDVRPNNNLQPIHFALKWWKRVTFPVEYLISENCNLSHASYDQVKACIDEDYLDLSELDVNGILDNDRLDMLKLLFACGLPRHLCQSFIVDQETSVRNWVETVASQTSTLKSICVYKIRRNLGHGIKSKVTKLNLPNVIQNLILLKGILSLDCFD